MRFFPVLLITSLFCCTENLIDPGQIETIQAVNNRDYFRCALSGLESAEESVDLLMYLVKLSSGIEDSVHLLLDGLVDAHRRGVKTRVLLENSLEENFIAADYLESRGVMVKFDSPRLTSHAKFILVDAQHLILGSSNWTNSALKSNNEANLLISHQQLAQGYRAYFDQLWISSEGAVGPTPLSRAP
jgi:phosphatidylserine/phosphatidylglycerophosphate/cardiolipin synthase-like enzyme